jgi:hypothetical protein
MVPQVADTGRMKAYWSLLSVFAVACGGGEAPPPKTALMTEMESSCTTESTPSNKAVGSCVLRSPAGEYCIDFTGTNTPTTSAENCTEKLHGEYSAEMCKEAGIVSRCLVQCGKPGEGISTYYYGDVAELANKCATSRGTLLASPAR